MAHVQYPPGQGHVLVPEAPASAAALGLTLYTASRPVPLMLQRATWVLARAGAMRLVPGVREQWNPPLDADVFAELSRQWRAAIGGARTEFAVYRRPQGFRTGIVLLLCTPRRPMLIRVRRDAAELAAEKAISQAAAEQQPARFRVPQLVGEGSAGGWSWTGYEVMARRPHGPVLHCADELTNEITELVERVVPRPRDAAAHWRGAHGDLTPWNLRRAQGQLWLIDWEDVRWAPPHADTTYFLASAAALRGRRRDARLRAPGAAEARLYWADIVQGRRIADREQRLTTAMLEALRA